LSYCPLVPEQKCREGSNKGLRRGQLKPKREKKSETSLKKGGEKGEEKEAVLWFNLEREGKRVRHGRQEGGDRNVKRGGL